MARPCFKSHVQGTLALVITDLQLERDRTTPRSQDSFNLMFERMQDISLRVSLHARRRIPISNFIAATLLTPK